VFELLRSFRHDNAAVFCAFDLLEADGEDLCRMPIEMRKAALTLLLRARLASMAGLALFGAASCIIPIADTQATLLAGRTLQGFAAYSGRGRHRRGA
jgi:hypothetical protein